jgi:hypothetical protein
MATFDPYAQRRRAASLKARNLRALTDLGSVPITGRYMAPFRSGELAGRRVFFFSSARREYKAV